VHTPFYPVDSVCPCALFTVKKSGAYVAGLERGERNIQSCTRRVAGEVADAVQGGFTKR
jgi:hypothetical protein